MERICPYLALADDGRTVADGFDAEHLCHALTPPAPLERTRQLQLCLTEAHLRCERFGAARTAWLAASSGLPRVSADVAFGRTRLIVEPEPAGRGRAASVGGLSRRTVLLGAAGATLVVVLGLAGISGAFSGTPAGTASPTPDATNSTTPATAPPASLAAPPSIAPTAPASNTPAPTPAATPAATPRTYTVQLGDTLNEIAQRFGTSAQAIANANGIAVNDTLDVGQVLVIP